MFFFFRSARCSHKMASPPQPQRGPVSTPVARLAEPLKRFHKEAWHTPHGRLIREVIFGPPVQIAAITGFSYLAGALLTLVPYFFHHAPQPTLAMAASLAVATLLVIGAAKTWLTKENPLTASLELVGLGVLACAVGLVVGHLVGVAV